MGVSAQSCRALPGLTFLLALPKRKQKASAKFLGDPKSFCRLNQTNGLSPRLILRRPQRIGCPACVTNARPLTPS
ncbi:hypothetical protein KL86DYS1_30801 [uncultured Dysgonomonas sp.]|uniref:Uncharacterized protein n=1 Tax=uncultured Dysgonomonas sp. TaxID=206096 RepID=A0A212JY53_9BACT|nr:hypothetical protein KL86DYS1_30801 [uncultured Dysgonomonas sp.]